MGCCVWGQKVHVEKVNVLFRSPMKACRSGEKKTNKHKQLRGIVPEMGGGQIVYVFPLFLGKKGNT